METLSRICVELEIEWITRRPTLSIMPLDIYSVRGNLALTIIDGASYSNQVFETQTDIIMSNSGFGDVLLNQTKT